MARPDPRLERKLAIISTRARNKREKSKNRGIVSQLILDKNCKCPSL